MQVVLSAAAAAAQSNLRVAQATEMVRVKQDIAAKAAADVAAAEADLVAAQEADAVAQEYYKRAAGEAEADAE
jgi:hypothetical protein